MENRIVKLFKALNQELEVNKMQHVQVLMTCTKDRNRLVAKFTSVDTEDLKRKVKELADRYHESLVLYKETKTTISYLV